VPLILGNYYGAAVYSRVYGNLMPFNTVITALAPTVAALIFTATGAYTVALYAFAGIAVLGIVCAIFARPPHMTEADKAAAAAKGDTAA